MHSSDANCEQRVMGSEVLPASHHVCIFKPNTAEMHFSTSSLRCSELLQSACRQSLHWMEQGCGTTFYWADLCNRCSMDWRP